MVSNSGNRWAIAASTFVVWGLVAASAVYWGMKLSSAGASAPVAPIARGTATPDPAATARLLGATPSAGAAPVASLSSRFNLQGVVAEADGGGAALIAVDGKPPRPYRVGASVDESLVLKSVDARRAVLAANLQAAPAVTLELPLKR